MIKLLATIFIVFASIGLGLLVSWFAISFITLEPDFHNWNYDLRFFAWVIALIAAPAWCFGMYRGLFIRY